MQTLPGRLSVGTGRKTDDGILQVPVVVGLDTGDSLEPVVEQQAKRLEELNQKRRPEDQWAKLVESIAWVSPVSYI
ncbi:hypothetical protein [Halodesulfurarchaeum sp.]|uniref:hypothetical protein n=1 Tax=Halodesulfurarchaeum sp. TaxID=1980530 RepID=UPI002FC3A730